MFVRRCGKWKGLTGNYTARKRKGMVPPLHAVEDFMVSLSGMNDGKQLRPVIYEALANFPVTLKLMLTI